MVAVAPRSEAYVGSRLLAGAADYERLEAHASRLGPRPVATQGLIDVVAESGLRGRGGAWFSTGRKWSAVAQASRGDAIVVINASEGEPLSAKDQHLMSLRPHLVFDGAALAAEALGASEIVLYLSRGLHAERTIERALKERGRAAVAEPPIRVVKTAHRYIAGESSAVINRLSGGTSKPLFSLVRAAEKGINDRPTLIQNAETLAHAAMIARYGSKWFRKLGTESSPGSALITVCGNVRHPGVYEIDIGAPLTSVLDAIGSFASPPAGALIGGYFGTWLPPRALASAVLDPDWLRQHGAAFGCGVIAVLPQDGCAIVEASRVLSYLAAESAGQCGPCVNGLNALAETMERIAASQPEPGDIERVQRWIDMVRDRGACHHPDGAVGMLESAIKNFSQHLIAHLAGRRCAGLDTRGFPPPPAPGDRWR